MGFKDKLTSYYSESYMQKYGDRITSTSGTVLSIKTETKSFLGLLNKISVLIVIKPEQGKQVVKTEFVGKRWFKKPSFIDVNKGNKVIIMGIKGEKGKPNSDTIAISNIANLSTKVDLHPFDHSQIKKARQQATRMRTK